MAEIKQGFVTVTLPQGVELPPEAHTITADALNRRTKARRSVGATCEATADDLERAQGRINVPGITPEGLRERARRADTWEPIIADLEFVLALIKRANLLDDSDAHEALRQVLAEIRAREKFDPTITGLVGGLLRYFK